MGIWSEEDFTAWKDAHVYIEASGKEVITYLAEDLLSVFSFCYDLYPVEKTEHKALASLLQALETERLTNFWLEMKQHFSA